MKTRTGAKPGIDAVRDLIFGENIKEYEIKFANLENEFKAKLQTLDKKIASLDKAIKSVKTSSAKFQSSVVEKDTLCIILDELSASLKERSSS